MEETQTIAEAAPVRTSWPRLSGLYASLPERFHVRTQPEPASQPRLIRFNHELARSIGLFDKGAAPDDAMLAAIFSGNAVPEGAHPVAMAYAGHQFGSFVPRLGDGRAVLLGEAAGPDGRIRDIHLKGSGRTAFSRGGDGKAAVGPVLREYIVSEAMAALGIPTTRSLAAVLTGDPVYREIRLPGAVLARVALSHVRVGTFQYFAARSDEEALRLLADHAIHRLYPDARETASPYVALYEGVVRRQADLIARWMQAGFIHGVMNTDNMAISGETIDYGPCAFMDAYDPAQVYSSIDHYGRYAFTNQPAIAQWNLARLAEAMLPLFDPDQDRAVEIAQEKLAGFKPRFEESLLSGMRVKLGLFAEREEDGALVRGLLETMTKGRSDFTLTFRTLAEDVEAPSPETMKTRALFSDPAAFDGWALLWRERLSAEPGEAGERKARMNAANPKYIPRNHRVEAAIEAAVARDDFEPFRELLGVVTRPFDEQPGMERYAKPPEPHEEVLQTFCGT